MQLAFNFVGRKSAVGTSMLRAERSADRIHLGARFSAVVHTGPGATLPSVQWGIWLSLAVEEPGRGVNYRPQFGAKS